ncbi:hypothetical protein XENOCAPTIV_018037 [Xenoophorus captivus]|uniref:Uncharacterized protein n=1 Tax=Xenoophorus captivus TaxID=1517983 RepID=A0ABV0QSF5_9TELE
MAFTVVIWIPKSFEMSLTVSKRIDFNDLVMNQDECGIHILGVCSFHSIPLETGFSTSIMKQRVTFKGRNNKAGRREHSTVHSTDFCHGNHRSQQPDHKGNIGFFFS